MKINSSCVLTKNRQQILRRIKTKHSLYLLWAYSQNVYLCGHSCQCRENKSRVLIKYEYTPLNAIVVYVHTNLSASN